MSSPSAGKRRMDTDVIKLIESKHEVTILSGLNEFSVKFYGPRGTPYEGGIWMVRVHLPEHYPFKSPSIGFMNKVYHPNIDEVSGTVCLDVINQAWTALYDLSNIFESFLPQLLTYPNPIDPLNGDAAAMYLHKPEEYKKKVADYVRKYATEEALREQEKIAGSTGNGMSSDSESSMSDFSEDEAQDMELAAHQQTIATSSAAAAERGSNPSRKRPHDGDAHDVGTTTRPPSKIARPWSLIRRATGANGTSTMLQASPQALCPGLRASGSRDAEGTRASHATGLTSPCAHPPGANANLLDPGGCGSDANSVRENF